ncbi:uncharacterized protein AB675_4316 [Cyphellophora attinorum]|uniref:Uncharacterized protein n=1 Tax=Cyphellophora attinorum TaxID=1664694 RepID=A0A0N0NKY0_9EURO|nr:uncharacterized protein AB675_4316 [Phialophora attinorum]KPI38671.1 hypothetical protein AB675_4316 [Phialophora attinorum]
MAQYTPSNSDSVTSRSNSPPQTLTSAMPGPHELAAMREFIDHIAGVLPETGYEKVLQDRARRIQRLRFADEKSKQSRALKDAVGKIQNGASTLSEKVNGLVSGVPDYGHLPVAAPANKGEVISWSTDNNDPHNTWEQQDNIPFGGDDNEDLRNTCPAVLVAAEDIPMQLAAPAPAALVSQTRSCGEFRAVGVAAQDISSMNALHHPSMIRKIIDVSAKGAVFRQMKR